MQPILDKHCVECHGPNEPDGGICLDGGRGMPSHGRGRVLTSYVALVRRLGEVADGRNAHGNRAPRTIGSSASKLMTRIDGSHYDVKVSPQEATLVRLWLDSGAVANGTYAIMDGGTPENPSATYIREMKRYGILPPDFDPATDPDRRLRHRRGLLPVVLASAGIVLTDTRGDNGMNTTSKLGILTLLVPKLQLGNACSGSSASLPAKQSFADMGPQAGAWVPGAKTGLFTLLVLYGFSSAFSAVQAADAQAPKAAAEIVRPANRITPEERAKIEAAIPEKRPPGPARGGGC